MEEYLETIVTILIGIGAFLISAIKKQKNSKEKLSKLGEEQHIGNLCENGNEKYEVNTNREENPTLSKENLRQRKPIRGFIHANNNNKNSFENSLNQDYSNSTPYVEKEKNNKNVKKHKKKVAFNTRKAIVYSTIINRKYS